MSSSCFSDSLPVGSVVKIVQSRGGSCLLSILRGHFPKQDLEQICKFLKKNHHLFNLVEDSSLVEFRPKIKVCIEYLVDGVCIRDTKCWNLHICQNFIRDQCFFDSDCIAGHSFLTDHNQKVLNNFYLSDIPEVHLKSILCMTEGNRKPVICKFYNEGECKNSSCHHLHICRSFVENLGECVLSNCQLNHDILEKDCKRYLIKHNLWSVDTPRDILCSLLKSMNISQCSKETSSSNILQENGGYQTVWADRLDGNAKVSEICLFSLYSKCNRERCPYLHAKWPYQWQICCKHKWYNLLKQQNIEIELCYRDPHKERMALSVENYTHENIHEKKICDIFGNEPVTVNFDEMKVHRTSNTTFDIRRLSTKAFSAYKGPKSMVYKWYYIDDDNSWKEVNTLKDAGVVTSERLDEDFIKRRQKHAPEYISDYCQVDFNKFFFMHSHN